MWGLPPHWLLFYSQANWKEVIMSREPAFVLLPGCAHKRGHLPHGPAQQLRLLLPSCGVMMDRATNRKPKSTPFLKFIVWFQMASLMLDHLLDGPQDEVALPTLLIYQVEFWGIPLPFQTTFLSLALPCSSRLPRGWGECTALLSLILDHWVSQIWAGSQCFLGCVLPLAVLDPLTRVSCSTVRTTTLP